MSQPRIRPVTNKPVHLVDALNGMFGLDLADAPAAGAWLKEGGWERFDAWIAARPNGKSDSGRVAHDRQLGHPEGQRHDG